MSVNHEHLISRLPRLPQSAGVKLPSSTIAGLKASVGGGFALTGDPLQMADVRMGPGFFGKSAVYVPDKDVDLSQKNYLRRKLLVFDGRHGAFRQTLNKELGGGESYPVLTTALGIGAGFLSAAVGVAFSAFATAVSVANEPQPVRARPGDEVHQLEIVGVQDGKVVHADCIILVDPFRAQGCLESSQWVIHEDRNEMKLL